MTILRGTGRRAQFVVKISKYCNLRCSYCYEFPDLGKPERMSLDQIRTLFRNIAGYVIANQYLDIEFVWHGGEPFLIPLYYYDEIAKLQKEIFSDKVSVSNGVQTNLTILTDRHLEYLKARRFFSGIGVSIDPYGDQRVDKSGRQTTPIVLANMQRLLDASVPFGGIVVVARNTITHMNNICRFFDKLGINVCFLPFYLTAPDEIMSNQQWDNHAITFDELISAFKVIIHEWFESSNATTWNPLDEYIDFTLAHINGKPTCHYDRSEGESVFVVNLDGRVWGAGETYLSECAYGNLFVHDFGTILSSESRKIRSQRAKERMRDYCAPCPYYGACPGFFVGDASIQQELLLANRGCPVRVIIEELLKKLDKTGLTGALVRPGAEAQSGSAKYAQDTARGQDAKTEPTAGLLAKWTAASTS
jgi:uncharacterized protein